MLGHLLWCLSFLFSFFFKQTAKSNLQRQRSRPGPGAAVKGKFGPPAVFRITCGSIFSFVLKDHSRILKDNQVKVDKWLCKKHMNTSHTFFTCYPWRTRVTNVVLFHARQRSWKKLRSPYSYSILFNQRKKKLRRKYSDSEEQLKKFSSNIYLGFLAIIYIAESDTPSPLLSKVFISSNFVWSFVYTQVSSFNRRKSHRTDKWHANYWVITFISFLRVACHVM